MASLDSSKGAGVAQQIPRNSLALLIVSQAAVIVPLAAHISLWIAGVCLFCGYWRTQVHMGRWGYPGGWVKAGLVFAAIGGIALSGYRTFSLEAAASLLVLAFALKLVEMKNRRDAYLVIYLSYFLIATAFLFDQSMALAAYEVLAAIVITAAMVGLNQLQSRVRPVASLKVAAALVLQAVPLTLVLFLLFPRIAPLWSIPVPSAATTGISDKLTPGDVATLTQSDELAFRAVFDGDVPAQRDLYWRGLVYSNFKYGTWSIAEPLAAITPPPGVGETTRYEIFLEPTQSKWLFSLDTPVEHGQRMELLGDYRLVNPEPVMSVMRYKLLSDSGAAMDPELDQQIRIRETRIDDPQDNPRLQAFAENLFEQTGSAEAMVEALLSHLIDKGYRYTLQPPELGDRFYNTIDQFWFDTQAGFCTHYAGAFVYALRSVGIPARMIGGYQGGEYNPVTGHLMVRQYQAHSWVEVWLPDQGWTRYDPTSVVAPARLENGLNAALSSEDRATLAFITNARFGNAGLINNILQWADSLEHRWNLWVVGYDADTQSSVLKDLLGQVTPTRVGFALLAGGGFSLLLVTGAIFWRRRPRQRHPVERLMHRFSTGMARSGYGREPGETPAAYIGRLAGMADLDGTEMAQRMQRQLYDPDGGNVGVERRKLRKDLRRLRFRLALRAVAID